MKELIESALGIPCSADIRLTTAGPYGKIAWAKSQHDIATLVVAGGGRLILERPTMATRTATPCISPGTVSVSLL